MVEIGNDENEAGEEVDGDVKEAAEAIFVADAEDDVKLEGIVPHQKGRDEPQEYVAELVHDAGA
jgi:hypothetical protein